MNHQLATLNRSVSLIRSKFEQVKKLDGTPDDASPAGDGYVKIADEYESRGSVRFDQAGEPESMEFTQWDSSASWDESARQETSYFISRHESGNLYFYSEVSSADGDTWSPGPRIAVEPGTGKVTGTFDISAQPHKFVPLG